MFTQILSKTLEEIHFLTIFVGKIRNMQIMDYLVRPRLNDYYEVYLDQDSVDFAIPFLDEDIPFYVDPFRLWSSPSSQDKGQHLLLKRAFNRLGTMFSGGAKQQSIDVLKELSECNEVGLGSSLTKNGKRIGSDLAEQILDLYKRIPFIVKNGIEHIESIQFLVDGIGKDRISDIACNLIGSFLVDYTIQESNHYALPTEVVPIRVFDVNTMSMKAEKCSLPVNPITKQPVWLVPKRWLRKTLWLNNDDFLNHYLVENIEGLKRGEIDIVTYNRDNFDLLLGYVKQKELTSVDCKNDPLFMQIPLISAKRKLGELKKLPTGNAESADKQYERIICPLFASMLYPHMDFAKSQSRTDSGALIRDLVFYNNRSHPFLTDMNDLFGSRQIVMELKNVAEVSREHINQLNRYLNPVFGSFGIIVTRKRPRKSVLQNTIDLWAGQRKCILILDDTDVELMVNVFESKQRNPIDIIRKKYYEFTQKCPS